MRLSIQNREPMRREKKVVALQALKHYVRSTDADFERASNGGRIPGPPGGPAV
jgi:hypothetical protein